MPQDIQVEESLAAEQAHQPHPQVYFSDMGTNSSPWGWWALFAALNLALVHSLGAPQLNSERLHVCWYVSLWSWSGSWRGRHSGLAYRIWDFRSCGLLSRWLGTRGAGHKVGSFHRRLGKEGAGIWCDSSQESIETLHLWPHNCLPKFPPSLCFQMLRFLL